MLPSFFRADRLRLRTDNINMANNMANIFDDSKAGYNIQDLEMFSDSVMRFYGVDNNRFKLEGFVFEAKEDESDGYRSFLGSIKINPEEQSDRLIFFSQPIASIEIKWYDSGKCPGMPDFKGYQFEDYEDGHVWLRIGTDNINDYYPCFHFEYLPKLLSQG